MKSFAQHLQESIEFVRAYSMPGGKKVYKPNNKKELIKLIQENQDKDNLNFIDISLFDDLSFVFENSKAFDISEWNVAGVTNMKGIFKNAKGKIKDFNIEKWNTAKVKDFSFAFYNTNLEGVSLKKWNILEANNMNSMFAKTRNTSKLEISKWNVDEVSDLGSMFRQSQFNHDVSHWVINSDTNTNRMFYGSAYKHDAPLKIKNYNNND
jgi:hypothetical protein